MTNKNINSRSRPILENFMYLKIKNTSIKYLNFYEYSIDMRHDFLGNFIRLLILVYLALMYCFSKKRQTVVSLYSARKSYQPINQSSLTRERPKTNIPQFETNQYHQINWPRLQSFNIHHEAKGTETRLSWTSSSSQCTRRPY